MSLTNTLTQAWRRKWEMGTETHRPWRKENEGKIEININSTRRGKDDGNKRE